MITNNRIRLHLDKILFGLACLYLGGVLVWLATRQTEPTPQTLTPSPQEAQFIAYLEKSLDLIDQQKNQPLPSPVVPVAPVNNTPNVERIYVPVYPPAPVPAPPVALSRPPVTPPPPRVLKPIAPPPRPPQSVPVLTPGENLVPANMGYTLVGIVELGDRSVALFDTQGLTKRLSLGESLGNWRIVAIDNQQVKLSHNGMIKSLSLGQSF